MMVEDVYKNNNERDDAFFVKPIGADDRTSKVFFTRR